MCEICLIYIDQIIMSKMFHPAGLKNKLNLNVDGSINKITNICKQIYFH